MPASRVDRALAAAARHHEQRSQVNRYQLQNRKLILRYTNPVAQLGQLHFSETGGWTTRTRAGNLVHVGRCMSKNFLQGVRASWSSHVYTPRRGRVNSSIAGQPGTPRRHFLTIDPTESLGQPRSGSGRKRVGNRRRRVWDRSLSIVDRSLLLRLYAVSDGFGLHNHEKFNFAALDITRNAYTCREVAFYF